VQSHKGCRGARDEDAELVYSVVGRVEGAIVHEGR